MSQPLLLILLGLALLALAATGVLFHHIARLNRFARERERGESALPLPRSPLRMLDETGTHMDRLAKALLDLQRMEEYSQKTLAYEKKELAHFLEKENLARQMASQIQELRNANLTIASLNTDMEDKNRSLNEAINRLSALNQISRVLGMAHERKQVYQMVVSLPMELLRAEIGHLLLHDPVSGELVLDYSQGLNERPGRRMPVGTGMAGWVAKHRKALLIPDFSRQDLFSPVSSLGYERRSAVSVPLVLKEDLLGVVTLINREGGVPFSEEDRTLLATIAAEGSMALHNLLLLEKMQSSYFGMVKALVTAMEAKDVYTRGHSERVTQYSMLIAEQLKLPRIKMDIIQKAGFLHDIGKLTVELSILNSPNPLSPDELSRIRLHPEVGFRILEPIDFEDEIKVSILQHHERLDGKGYPRGCPADEIILESRILAVADAFDAMTTKRPYRDPVAIPDAMKELVRCSGTQFDARVVDAFRTKVDALLWVGRNASRH